MTENGMELMKAQEVRLPGWTEERYFTEAPEEGFYELKDGELIMHSPVSMEHQDVAAFLFTILRACSSARGAGRVFAGPAVLRLVEGLDREPDIFFVASSRLDQIHHQYTEAPVELVVEVTSEGSESRDVEDKREEYEAAGILEYWVVDPTARRVLVHRRRAGRFERQDISEGRLESQTMPGFWIQVEWLWQRPLPSEMDCLALLMGQSKRR